MDLDLFSSSPSGRLVPTIGDHCGFVPNPLPPKLNLNSLEPTLAAANMAIGELKGIATYSQNPYLLVRPLQSSEALASSRMEGTFSSLEDVAIIDANPESRSQDVDAREVRNYNSALEFGIEALEVLPVSGRLILLVHKVLMNGLPPERTGRRNPGEYRSEQNFISKRGIKEIARARFVPPPPPFHVDAMNDLEKYINSDRSEEFSPLVNLALAHYQFEAIHPFPDGNGRVGRILMPLMLHSQKVLPQPFLYLSPYLEETKDEYIDLMYNVSAKGEWLPWIEYFLRAVEVSAQDSIRKIKSIEDLRAKTKSSCQTARASALLPQIIDRVFEKLVTTRPDIQKVCEITNKSAAENIKKLQDIGFLRELPDRGRKKYYYSPDLFSLIR